MPPQLPPELLMQLLGQGGPQGPQPGPPMPPVGMAPQGPPQGMPPQGMPPQGMAPQQEAPNPLMQMISQGASTYGGMMRQNNFAEPPSPVVDQTDGMPPIIRDAIQRRLFTRGM